MGLVSGWTAVPGVVVTLTAIIGLALSLGLLSGPAPGARETLPGIPDQIDWQKVPEYRIVPGDELLLNFGPRVDDVTDVTRPAVVRPDGRITVFPVGDIVVAGRTPAEVQAALQQLLAAEYKQPRVTVEVVKMAENQVHVLGRVKRPGSQPVGSFSTLLQALAGAGGFEDDAARNSVLVMHRAGPGSVIVARIRVGRLLKGGGDVPLSRFDIVYVPRSTIGNVDLFVRQFFGETVTLLNFSILGWELFNLNRIFVVRSTVSQ
jgi:protein involved in polysaccharide export with SLBB domain